MAEQFPCFQPSVDFLNFENTDHFDESSGEADLAETERNQLLLETQAKATKSATTDYFIKGMTRLVPCTLLSYISTWEIFKQSSLRLVLL